MRSESCPGRVPRVLQAQKMAALSKDRAPNAWCISGKCTDGDKGHMMGREEWGRNGKLVRQVVSELNAVLRVWTLS